MKKSTEWIKLKKEPVRVGGRYLIQMFVCFGRLFRVAFVFGGTPFLLGLLGRYFDSYFQGTRSYFMVIFLIVGFILGGVYSFFELKKLLKES